VPAPGESVGPRNPTNCQTAAGPPRRRARRYLPAAVSRNFFQRLTLKDTLERRWRPYRNEQVCRRLCSNIVRRLVFVRLSLRIPLLPTAPWTEALPHLPGPKRRSMNRINRQLILLRVV
jgi:hypothetical protein